MKNNLVLYAEKARALCASGQPLYWLSPRYEVAPCEEGRPRIWDSHQALSIGPLANAQGELDVLPEHIYLEGENPVSLLEAFPPHALQAERYG